MEQNFQTSFIPKKPMIEDRAVTARPVVSFFLIISIFILILTVVSSAGVYIYKGVVEKNIKTKQGNLDLAKNGFEPAKINQLQVLDKRLKASSQIVSKHIAISPIFSALEKVTMKTVRFTKFDYSVNDQKNNSVLVKMSGMATNYKSIALQSDLLLKNKSFINPVFSNLSLDNTGNVLFDLEFSVDPVFVDYKESLSSMINPN
mgnify:CR=1 FL=1